MATSKHALNGKIGALESWSRTKDRTKRTAPGHSKSPCSLAYWVAKTRADGSSQPRPVPSRRDGTSVGDSSTGSRRARENEDDLKIEQQIAALLLEETGRTVSPEWATRVRRQILDGRSVKNPASYVATSIRSDPARYLPGDTHPSDRTVAEAIAAARGEA